MKHTKGPWFNADGVVHNGNKTVGWTFDEKGDPLCGPSFKRAKKENFAKGCDEAEANANLIAAAPDLLDRLEHSQRLLCSYERLERDKNNTIQADAIRRRIKQNSAAIAKAKGETQ